MGANSDWCPPDSDALFLIYDDETDGAPSRIATYSDILSEIEPEFWPQTADEFDLLMWSYDAEPL